MLWNDHRASKNLEAVKDAFKQSLSSSKAITFKEIAMIVYFSCLPC